MAEKRMLSKKVLDTDAFLDMPLSAQALYFHLVINADDEGFVGNPKRIRDYIGATESDLDLLIEKRFVLMLKNSVAVIRHWKIHNTLRRDRSHPTVFTEEKSQLILQENGAYAEKVTSGCAHDNQMSTACQPDVNQRLTSCQPNDNKMSTEDKIEEDRLREDKIEEVVTPAISERRAIRFHKPTIDEIVEVENLDDLEDLFESSFNIHEELLQLLLDHYILIAHNLEELKERVDWDSLLAELKNKK